METRAASKPLIKGSLRAPQQPPAAPSYTQAPRLKSETEVNQPGSKQVVDFKEVSLTALPQPFVNPADAFSRLRLRPPDEGRGGAP